MSGSGVIGFLYGIRDMVINISSLASLSGQCRPLSLLASVPLSQLPPTSQETLHHPLLPSTHFTASLRRKVHISVYEKSACNSRNAVVICSK